MDNLNRWLAENVMGWELNPWWIKTFKEGWYDPNKKGIIEGLVGEPVMPVEIWRPRTNIAQAFQVAGELRKESMWLSLRQISSASAPWEAVFSFGGMAVGGNRERGRARDDTPEMAISLAAKKAKEEK